MQLLFEYMQEPLWPWAAIGAWFIQMGIHEGAHAYVAYACGDPTADALGKRTINPLAHIEWNNPSSLIWSIALPIYTVFGMRSPIPMGMAWVPVDLSRLRNPRRDHALVAIAGPASNLALCAVCLGLHYGVVQFLGDSRTVVGIDVTLAAIFLTSLAYGLFNLIPIPPLDGSRVLMWLVNHDTRKILHSIEPYGILIVFGLFWFIDPVNREFWRIVFTVAGLFR